MGTNTHTNDTKEEKKKHQAVLDSCRTRTCTAADPATSPLSCQKTCFLVEFPALDQSCLRVTILSAICHPGTPARLRQSPLLLTQGSLSTNVCLLHGCPLLAVLSSHSGQKSAFRSLPFLCLLTFSPGLAGHCSLSSATVAMKITKKIKGRYPFIFYKFAICKKFFCADINGIKRDFGVTCMCDYYGKFAKHCHILECTVSSWYSPEISWCFRSS